MKRGGSYPGIQRANFDDYLQTLWNEARRAWEKYNMLLIPGTELTNENYHILAIDIKQYVDPTLPVEKIIKDVHRQSGIAVACHPHHKESDRTHTSLYLWERYEQAIRKNQNVSIHLFRKGSNSSQ